MSLGTAIELHNLSKYTLKSFLQYTSRILFLFMACFAKKVLVWDWSLRKRLFSLRISFFSFGSVKAIQNIKKIKHSTLRLEYFDILVAILKIGA